MRMTTLEEVGNIEGKRVLVRVDWNVPVDHSSGQAQVVDDYRIKCSMPTLELLKSKGAKVSVATHLEPASESAEFLRPYLPDGVELLDNLRKNAGEKNGDTDFAKFLSGKADIFVNEAFSASHRKHASIVGIPEFLPSYAGLQFMREIEHLSKAFNPPRPFLLIMGGAKLETKLPLVEKFLNIADQIFIGGTIAGEAEGTPLSENPKLFYPHGDIRALDVNEETIEDLKSKIESSQFVVWNGPLGKYEEEKYQWGTKELAKILAESGKEVIVGGGDTLAAIGELKLHDKFSFVSTGGGAMLDFLANGTLPGIEALAVEQE